MTTRPSDPDYWYYPDAESLPAEFGGKERPAPVPEGMETTARERHNVMLAASGWDDPDDVWMRALLRDLDRALAEIARLTAEQPPADTEWYAERHTAYETGKADGWREGAEATREACAKIAEDFHSSQLTEAGLDIAAAILALPIPSPPVEETKT